MPNSLLSRAEAGAYLERIGLPSDLLPPLPPPSSPSSNGPSSTPRRPPLDLELLTTLHVHHLSAVPYENLLLHYSPTDTPEVSLSPHDLFNKVVRDGSKSGRGGYCLELGILYGELLRALGFDAYPTGARIRRRKGTVPSGDYIGWMHMVNIVTLPTGEKYAVDVSFGGDGPTFPLPLFPSIPPSPSSSSSSSSADAVAAPDPSSFPVFTNMGTQQIRLIRGALPEQKHPSSLSWIYQYRNNTSDPSSSSSSSSSSSKEGGGWNSYYAFSELEWTPADFENSNYALAANPDSFQREVVLVIKFLRRRQRRPCQRQPSGKGEVEKEGEEEEDEEEVIYGKKMLAGAVVKENIGGKDGKTATVRECRTEEERVLALDEVFGIRLTEEERNGVRGRPTGLKE